MTINNKLSSPTTKYHLILVVTFIVAAASILFELVLAESIAMMAMNRIIWYSIVIGVFVGSLGIGAMTLKPSTKPGQTLSRLITTEIVLAIVGMLAAILVFGAHSVHMFFLYQGSDLIAYSIFPILTLTTTIAVGFLSGRELPLLIDLAKGEAPYLSRSALSRVLGTDYVGSLIGTVLFVTLFVPNMSLITAGALVALANLLVVWVLVLAYRSAVLKRKRLLLSLACATIFGAMILGGSPTIERHFVERYYFYEQYVTSYGDFFSIQEPRGTLNRYRSPYQTIDLIDDPAQARGTALLAAYSSRDRSESDFPHHTTLYLNGDFQFTSDLEEIYHEWFAHVPIMLASSTPERVLVLGAGDGLLIRELIKYPDIQSITHVELDPVMDELARNNPTFRRLNENSLSDDRVHTVIGDAYTHVLNQDSLYDAIYIDFPYPNDYNLARLYSKEFYALVRKRLSPDGFMVLDAAGSEPVIVQTQYGPMPFVGRDWFVYHNTLLAAGFDELTAYQSLVEDTNEEALGVIRKSFASLEDLVSVRAGESPYENEEAYLQALLQSFIRSFTQGFIIAHNNSRPEYRFRDMGVELHVLNEERFNLSYLDYDGTEDVVDLPPNSIMRPTFTDTAIWRLRYPY